MWSNARGWKFTPCHASWRRLAGYAVDVDEVWENTREAGSNPVQWTAFSSIWRKKRKVRPASKSRGNTNPRQMSVQFEILKWASAGLGWALTPGFRVFLRVVSWWGLNFARSPASIFRSKTWTIRNLQDSRRKIVLNMRPCGRKLCLATVWERHYTVMNDRKIRPEKTRSLCNLLLEEDAEDQMDI
jgi:hypothetical protein